MGHTHEDIDGTYGRMSSKLKNKDVYYSPKMMDTYCTIKEKRVFPPKLIDKAYDFKTLFKRYTKEWKIAPVRHLNV